LRFTGIVSARPWRAGVHAYTKIHQPAHVGDWTMDLDPSNSFEVIVRRAGQASEMRLIYKPDDADAMAERLVRITEMASGNARQLVVQLHDKLWARRPTCVVSRPAPRIHSPDSQRSLGELDVSGGQGSRIGRCLALDTELPRNSSRGSGSKRETR
jgi:hypothetical protein